MENEEKKIKCGYYPRSKFLKKLPWAEIEQLAQIKGLEFIEINEENIADVHSHDLDFIVAKFSETFGNGNPLADKFREAEKKVRIIDSIHSQKLLFDRNLIAEILEKGTYPAEVMLPKFVVVNERKENYSSLIQSSNLSFPLIVKPVIACGTKESHYMSILFNEEQLHLHPPPFPAILQEYYNHNALIYKVYCVGPSLDIVRRHSIRNFNEDDETPILFDSQQMSNIVDKSRELPTENPELSIIESIRDNITNLTGLTMFGFDVIRDIKSNRYSVIDINFFPGFGGMTDFPKAFVDYLISLSRK